MDECGKQGRRSEKFRIRGSCKVSSSHAYLHMSTGTKKYRVCSCDCSCGLTENYRRHPLDAIHTAV